MRRQQKRESANPCKTPTPDQIYGVYLTRLVRNTQPPFSETPDGTVSRDRDARRKPQEQGGRGEPNGRRR